MIGMMGPSPAGLAKMLQNARKEMEEIMRKNCHVKDIYINKKKRTVAVKFTNGLVYTATCAEEDAFDPEVGVAVAIASLFCGSKKKFHQLCQRRMKDSEKPEKAKPVKAETK